MKGFCVNQMKLMYEFPYKEFNEKVDNFNIHIDRYEIELSSEQESVYRESKRSTLFCWFATLLMSLATAHQAVKIASGKGDGASSIATLVIYSLFLVASIVIAIKTEWSKFNSKIKWESIETEIKAPYLWEQSLKNESAEYNALMFRNKEFSSGCYESDYRLNAK